MSAAEALKAARAAGIELDTRRRRSGAGGGLGSRRPLCSTCCRATRPRSWRCCGPADDGWSAEDWQAFFDERAGIAEFDGGLSRLDAEMYRLRGLRRSVGWRLHPPVGGEHGYCLRCGSSVSDQDKSSVVVTCVGGTTGRLHASCASDWKNRRRWEARTALRWLLHRTRTMEIERTAGGG